MLADRRTWWVLCWALLSSLWVPEAYAADDRAFTDPGDLPQLRLVDGAGLLPLRHTDVHATVEGTVAEVEVVQTYHNAHETPIEAVYTFPLPENAAVRDLEIVIGDRVIRADIKTRDEARRTYEDARARGNTAALLEQERTNIFTQSVANIAPGEDIDVVLRYVQDLSYDAGSYEFVFPMVVGPRYTAGSKDAQRITPSVVGKGTRTGHDIDVEVTIDAGMPLRSLSVPTHDTQTRRGAQTTTVTLAEAKSIPNRDFVLRYRVDGPELQSTLFVPEGNDERFFTLLLQPPTSDVDALVGKRELVFVVDVSGSMYGPPLAMCKYAMRQALRQLRPVDTFNVLVFESGTGQAFDRPVPANQENIQAAASFIDGLRAGGGTEISSAVDAALSPPVGQGRHRYVFFLTDGFVSIEDEVFARTRAWVRRLGAKGQRARVFAMGTGSSPNRELLRKLTKAGKGVAVYASNREDPARAVNSFFRTIDSPALVEPRITWGGAKVSDLHPAELPDLYVSRPGVVHGRIRGSVPRRVTLVSKVGHRKVRVPVTVQTLPASRAATQGQLWARAEIEELELSAAVDGDPRQAAITELGLEHRLVTRYTSFVAVDTSRTVGEGQPARIEQPVDVPEAVDPSMAGARMYGPAPQQDARESASVSRSMRELDVSGAGCAHCTVGQGSGWGAWLLFGVLLGLRRRRSL